MKRNRRAVIAYRRTRTSGYGNKVRERGTGGFMFKRVIRTLEATDKKVYVPVGYSE